MERIRDAIQKARAARDGGPALVDLPGPSRARGRDRAAVGEAWTDLAEFKPDLAHLRRNRVITLDCEDPNYTVFDIMRTKVLAALKQHGWRSLAITSPSPHCGKTMIASNLAFSFARQKELRSLLIDVDLRRPQLAKTLGFPAGPSVGAFLSGTEDPTSQILRVGANLGIAASQRPTTHSSEILASSQTRRSIEAVYAALQPDVVIFDLPPLRAGDDTLAFLPLVDCTLLIVEAERTPVHLVDEIEQELAAKSNLLGVVLNKCRFETEDYGYYYN
jgi:Mrp family chromosome partitioning ATPase